MYGQLQVQGTQCINLSKVLS